ncbi:hypothetical protein DL239_02505 [Sedimentitalea sp. CY04]|uniref:DUF4136 domain-containing protein n=1 Tax=Parasedimentitalea denitrificans TaxID=2211118 RepID=A0ABX0W2I1_9RHOB|nr:hypothetical protein [Sedimentitalea sp. CY04]NIZ59843.1 hypothetical protein [Sedimentitalea sp. CY04]
MNTLFGALALSVVASSSCGQESITATDRGLNPEAIRAIQISLGDTATGACWTNLKEAREYAEEKLRIKGYNVVADLPSPQPPNFIFWIGVGASRDGSGLCGGSINVSVQSVAFVDEFAGRFILKSVNTFVGNAGNNLNRRVIEAIQAMASQM